MGIIYKATNSENGHSYIGQTQCTLEKRWAEHIRDCTRFDYKFSRALRKYGAESFMVEVLETVPNSLLNEREKYWIEKFSTYTTGYNSTLGGDGLLLVDKDAIINLWGNGLSAGEICNQTGACKQTVLGSIHTIRGISTDEIKARGRRNIMKKVCQYDLCGNFICEFPSMSVAANLLDIDRSMISACCRHKRRSAGKFQWRYADDGEPFGYVENQKLSRPVGQYSSTDDLIAKFHSLTQAQHLTGVGYSGISACCNGYRKSAGGFKWKYIISKGDDISCGQSKSNVVNV